MLPNAMIRKNREIGLVRKGMKLPLLNISAARKFFSAMGPTMNPMIKGWNCIPHFFIKKPRTPKMKMVITSNRRWFRP